MLLAKEKKAIHSTVNKLLKILLKILYLNIKLKNIKI